MVHCTDQVGGKSYQKDKTKYLTSGYNNLFSSLTLCHTDGKAHQCSMSVSDWDGEKYTPMVNINLYGHSYGAPGSGAGDQSGGQEHTEAGASRGDRAVLPLVKEKPTPVIYNAGECVSLHVDHLLNSRNESNPEDREGACFSFTSSSIL